MHECAFSRAPIAPSRVDFSGRLRLSDSAHVATDHSSLKGPTMASAECACVCCFDSFPAGAGLTCCGAAPGHFFCNDCFNDMVLSQVTGERKLSFIQSAAAIECPICLSASIRSIFDMRVCSCRVAPEVFTLYLKAVSEPLVIEAQRAVHQIFEEKLRDISFLQRRLAELTIEPYVSHIATLIGLRRCPGCQSMLILDPDTSADNVVRKNIWQACFIFNQSARFIVTYGATSLATRACDVWLVACEV